MNWLKYFGYGKNNLLAILGNNVNQAFKGTSHLEEKHLLI